MGDFHALLAHPSITRCYEMLIKKRTQGFTLIELIITMAILLILVLVAMPNMSRWALNSKVRSAAEALQNDIRMAQVEAVKQNSRVVVALTAATPASLATPSTSGTNWYVQNIPTTGSSQTSQMLYSSTLGTQNGLTMSVGGNGYICFNSAGRLSSGTVTGLSGSCAVGASATTPITFSLSVTGGNKPLNVQVYPAGKVRICDPDKALSSSQPDGC